ncbi:BLUF domain-containing protein [Dinoroseobacter sp. S375]|uniref:BLUF domain-containing protein n=1 Tax=Dinoroseobacter sp. S375 TaxID=3415136 RepID=UPI003C7D354D
MSLIQIAYVSRPFGYDASALAGILVDARARNREDDVTGALICRADLYCQLLEGPEQAVQACFSRIARDDRHLEVRKLASLPISHRLFPGWDMRHDPAESWMWSREETAAGQVETATENDILMVFRRLAAGRGAPE